MNGDEQVRLDKNPTRMVVTMTRYCLVFFPLATYTRVGEISKLTILSVTVYQRVCDVRCLFGFAWQSEQEA